MSAGGLSQINFCRERSYLVPLKDANSEDRAFRDCSLYFDSTDEKIFQESQTFCNEEGCSAPISKEIVPPDFDLGLLRKINEYSFAQKKKESEFLVKKSHLKKNKFENKNIGVLENIDRNLRLWGENLCEKSIKTLDFFNNLRNLQTEAKEKENPKIGKFLPRERV